MPRDAYIVMGVTQIIDSHLKVRNRLPLMVGETLIGEIMPTDHLNFYQRGGWLIGPVLMWATGGVLLWLGWRRLSKSPLGSSGLAKIDRLSKTPPAFRNEKPPWRNW